MSYMHIDNLYKNQDILLFKKCYAMEKIHGTSAHVSWKNEKLGFFSGGCDHDSFIKLFDIEKLSLLFKENIIGDAIVFGEAYGGKLQGMKNTYGDQLKFISFEVKIEDSWLNVPNAQQIAIALGLDFVHYDEINTDIDVINFYRDSPSVQAKRNGCGEDKKREGIVIRPVIEVKKNNGERIIAKHKNAEFREIKTPREIKDPCKTLRLTKANEIADEWVTLMRLNHVLDNFTNYDISITGEVIRAMCEDIERESVNEIVLSQEAKKAIGKNTAILFKKLLNKKTL